MNSQSLPQDSIERASQSLDHLDELLSAYIDDEIEANELVELNDVLSHDDDARKRCIDTVSLHVDLLAYFGNPSQNLAGPLN